MYIFFVLTGCKELLSGATDTEKDSFLAMKYTSSSKSNNAQEISITVFRPKAVVVLESLLKVKVVTVVIILH